LNENTWGKIANQYSSTVFLRILRAFFERLDYSTFDYAAAKRHNARMPAYKNMLQHFFPPALRFFKEYIETEKYDQERFQDADSNRKFYENPMFNQVVTVNARDIQEHLKDFLTEEKNPALTQFSSAQKFNNAIPDTGLPMKKSMKGRTVQWNFEPRKIYAFLTELMVVDQDLLEPAAIDALGGIVSLLQTEKEMADDEELFELPENV
jgi:hypothetical protein